MQLDPHTADLVSAALLRIRMKTPFFAMLSMFASLQASEKLTTPAATDGQHVFLDSEEFQRLKPGQQAGLLLHEVLHAALLHIPRRGTRDAALWNMAADIVVNGMIVQETGFELLEDSTRNPQLENLSVEEIYEILVATQQTPPPSSALDLLDDPPDGDTGQTSLSQETYWRNALAQADMVAQSSGQGSVAGNWLREFRRLEPAQLDWRSYLWRFVVHTPTDFSDYDRRFVGQRLYLETLSGESVRIFVAIDTSGSLSDEQLQPFLGELVGIIRAYPHLQCDLYYVDSAAHGPYPIKLGEPLPPPVGGGGTDFRPFFEAVERERALNGLCVYLTDGHGAFPSRPPELPVLWVVTPGGLDISRFPFGEAVQLLTQS